MITATNILLQAYSTAKTCRNALEFLERFNEAVHSQMDSDLLTMAQDGITASQGSAGIGQKKTVEFIQLVNLRIQFDRAWQKTFAHHRGRYEDEHAAALTFHNNFNTEIGAS